MLYAKERKIKRILKNSDFYAESELQNYSNKQLYIILRHCLFINLKNEKAQKTKDLSNPKIS